MVVKPATLTLRAVEDLLFNVCRWRFLLITVKSQSCIIKSCCLGLSTGASSKWVGITSKTKERGHVTQGHGELQKHWHCGLIRSTGSSWLRGNRKVTEGITRWAHVNYYTILPTLPAFIVHNAGVKWSCHMQFASGLIWSDFHAR